MNYFSKILKSEKFHDLLSIHATKASAMAKMEESQFSFFQLVTSFGLVKNFFPKQQQQNFNF